MKANNIINFKRDPHFKGIELCDVKDSNHCFPKHFHDNIYAFSLMESGGSYWTEKEKKNSLVKPGNIAMINPGVLHSGSPYKDNSSTYKMIYIEKDLISASFKDIFKDKDINPEFEKVVIKNLSSSIEFMNLYNSIQSEADLLEKESNLLQFVGELTKYTSENSAVVSKHEPNIIKIGTDLLRENLDQKISLEEISNVVGLSKYHFLRVFKKNTGTSPHIYRMQKRIEKAKVHLLEGKPLIQIALETGFSDQSHLSNKFREYTGATPKQYFTIHN
ncbi:MAG: AraC family transcriptional regulator [Spirochaetaceae bacterium]